MVVRAGVTIAAAGMSSMPITEEIVGDLQIGLACGTQGADRELIRVGEDRGGASGEREELGRCCRATRRIV